MITLEELKLVNYRNIKFQVLTFEGSSKIVGENRIGKTNTIEALYWLLTDKLLNGSKDIEQIKPLGNTDKKVEVSAKFDVDGKKITLGKEYQEEWVKTRGTDELVFKGHTTTYIYNGVKQGTKKQYDSLVATDFNIHCKDYVGIDVMQLLVNPLYLGRMGDTDDWKNLRTLIIDIVGDVNDADVFMAQPRLLPIKEDMERNLGRTDQMTKAYRDEIKTIKEDIIGCDANIQMLSQTKCPTTEEVEVANRGIDECLERFRSLKVEGADDQVLLSIDQEIMNLKNQIIEIKRRDLEKKNANPEIARKTELQSRKDELYRNAQDLVIERTKAIDSKYKQKIEVDRLQRLVDECKATRLNLGDEYKQVEEQIQHPAFEKECPHCHRPYDMDKIEEHLAEAMKILNERKANIVSKGKDNTEKMKAFELELDVARKEYVELDLAVKRIEDSVKIINDQFKDINIELEGLQFDDSVQFVNPEISALEEKIKAKEKEKEDIRSSQTAKEESVRSLIAEEQRKKEMFQKVIDDYNFYVRMQQQMQVTESKKKELTNALIKAEQKVELVKDFIKVKLEMLDENIKKVFDDVSFMLIDPQVNGGYATVCKPYIKGTKTLWKSGSKSEQITTGVAICEKIKTALGLPDLPYIFDEGGEISTDTFTNRFDTKSQLVCVQVKDGIILPTVIHI